MLTPRIKTEVDKFTRLFADAEEAIKTAQCAVEPTKDDELPGGVIVPAMNQLRYAGKHISSAMQSTTDEDALKEIAEAQTHCERAMYDAYDAAIHHYSAMCHIFKNDYHNFPITPVLPQYVDDRNKLNEIMDCVAHERRQWNERELFAQEKKAQTAALREISLKWESAREELNKQKEIRRQVALAGIQHDSANRKISKLCLWVAAVSLLVMLYVSFIQPKIQATQTLPPPPPGRESSRQSE